MNKKIAYITDIHLDEKFPIDQGIDARKNWRTILNDISSRGIEEIIFGGDIGEKTANKWFFDSLRDYTIAITLGNHDHFSEVIKHYNFELIAKHPQLYYRKEDENYKYIFLDSSAGIIGKGQLDWFKKELLTSKNVVLFIHHPILAIEAEVDRQFSLKERNTIKTELLNLDNDVTIFCGHYHLEDERRNGNIWQHITPASSYQVEKVLNEIKVNNDTFGYRVIEFHQKEISTELILFSSI